MNTAIPERIAQVREFAGFSKTELAQKLKVSVAAVSQWEDGSKNPTTVNLISIAQMLGVDVKLLMKPVPSVVLTRRGPTIFRAQTAAKTAQMKRRAHRFAEMASELFMMLEKWVSFPKIELPRVIPSNVEKAAADCRKAWGLGNLPIAKLASYLNQKASGFARLNLAMIVAMPIPALLMAGRSPFLERKKKTGRGRGST